MPPPLSHILRAAWNWLNNSAPASFKPFELIYVPRIRQTPGLSDETVREVAWQAGPKAPLTAIKQAPDASIERSGY